MACGCSNLMFKMKKSTVWTTELSLLLLFGFLAHVHGHGRLLDPPSRSSMWRQGYSNPINYQDNELFCGGFGMQYNENGGKCGVCGDPWNGPRENEAGGKYANGIIVRKYDVGQVMTAVVELTANHKGYFEFHICPTDNPFTKVTSACLEKFPLRVADTGEVRYPVKETGYSGKFNVKLQLPQNIKCRACLFQWKYNAGNSWGVDPDGTGCIGCGNQEQFYGCADIAIGYNDVELGKVPEKQPVVTGPGEIDETETEWKETEWHFGVVRYENRTGNNANTVQAKGFYNVVSLVMLNMFVMALLGILNRS